MDKFHLTTFVLFFSVSPYLKTLSMVASTKLLHLLEVHVLMSKFYVNCSVSPTVYWPGFLPLHSNYIFPTVTA